MRDDWPIWRVVTSKHFTEPKTEIETNWSLDDLYDAHDVIDMLEELERRRDETPTKS